MAVTAQQLANSISCHAWNAKATELAICPSNSEVHVYAVGAANSAWERTAVLAEHDQLVSGIDWSTKGDQIVTCSHDRNAYVWSRQEGRWQPEMVITRLSRAALCAQWSPCERKFALGSSSKAVCVCFYEPENAWWASRLIRKKHDSHVFAVAWHPAGRLVATASTDMKCRVFNASIPGVDDDSTSQGSFGDLLLEVDTGSGWCHSVAWSPSGSQLAFSSHGSMVHFLDGLDADQPASFSAAAAQPLVLQCLPLKALAFLTEGFAVGAGHDGEVMLFARGPDRRWAYLRTMQGSVPTMSTPTKRQVSANFSAALNKFQSPSKFASPAKAPSPAEVESPRPTSGPHTGCIIELHVMPKRPGNPLPRFSSAGQDGNVVVWEMRPLRDSMAGLRLS